MRQFSLFSLIVVILAVAACTSDGGDPVDLDIGGKADTAFADGAFYLTGGFDGSQRFGMWVDTMEFTRRIERDYGKRIRWTYFINTCYYDRTVDHSWIGTAMSREEEIVRWALTQQALNEGHEIANHSVRHQDGSDWSVEQWRTELNEFHQLVQANLFEPMIEYNEGEPEAVFPRWRPVPGVEAGEVGATCEADGDCDSGICLAVSNNRSFCSARCNRHNPCPDGTACGAPTWNESTDRCVPLPEFPVEYNEQVLFDAEGNANVAHPDLTPIQLVGFRAPQLGQNAALFEVLTELNYLYDTSQVLPIGPPQRTVRSGRTFEELYQFGLMRNPGSLTIPMDYNYKVNNGSGERMTSDYRQSILDAYIERDRQPWNIGHHFALWQNGAYWQAMQDAFEFAAQGCPDEAGEARCPDTEFPTFHQLATTLDGINRDRADSFDEDIFELPEGEEGLDPSELGGRDEDCHSEEECPD